MSTRPQSLETFWGRDGCLPQSRSLPLLESIGAPQLQGSLQMLLKGCLKVMPCNQSQKLLPIKKIECMHMTVCNNTTEWKGTENGEWPALHWWLLSVLAWVILQFSTTIGCLFVYLWYRGTHYLLVLLSISHTSPVVDIYYRSIMFFITGWNCQGLSMATPYLRKLIDDDSVVTEHWVLGLHQLHI